jgi:hypothetical protein
MLTKYNLDIPNKLTSEYLDYIIDRVYALLYMFENSLEDDEKHTLFIVSQDTLIQTINGNAELLQYNNVIIVDILSKLESLRLIKIHDDYRRKIFRICKQLSILKKEVEEGGI